MRLAEKTDKTGMTLPVWYASRLQNALQIDERRVFFVVGCQKSGTTWVQRLLDAHPRIACGGEGNFCDLILTLFKQAAEQYRNIQAQRREIDLEIAFNDDDLAASVRLITDGLLAQYLRRTAEPASIIAVGDKTPEHAGFIPLLEHLYPNARFIHIIRDGRDAAVSGWAHKHREDEAVAFESFADYADYFAEKHWVWNIKAARQGANAVPGRYLEIRYEALHTHPEEEMKKVLDFLGVDADDESIRTCLEKASFHVLSGGREPGREDAESFYRKGVVGDWKNMFDDDAERRFNHVAGNLLETLGYDVPIPTLRHEPRRLELSETP